MQGSAHPRSIDEIFIDFQNRKTGLRLALTDEQEVFYRQCDPQKENLCLYGEPDGRWVVDLPAEEVPPELPEPCLGINFARDGMKRSDWLSLVAVHSDAWLVSVAFYYGAKLDANGRIQLYRLINNEPTLYELVTGKHLRNRFDYPGGAVGPTGMRTEGASAPLPHGRLLTHADINLNLRGRRAELFWPDDNLWYMVEIHSINPRSRQAKIQYSSGEFEDLDLQEIIREGHCSLVHI